MSSTGNPISTAANTAELMRMAEHAFDAGDWSAAETYCQHVVSKGEHAGALGLLGLIAAQTRRLEQAATLLERAVAADPETAPPYNNLGIVLRELGRPAQALASYERALELAPDFAEAYSNRGSTLQELGRHGEALASYDRALRLRPDYAEAWFNRASALLQSGRLGDAALSFERSLALRPDWAEAHGNHGNVRLELGQYEEAVGSYERALALRPEIAEIWSNRGDALRRLNRAAEAAVSCERALQLNPRLAEAWNNRGNALRNLGRFTEALESYAQALAIRPDYAEACNNGGNVLVELRRFDDAARRYEQTLAIRPDYPWLPGTAFHTRMHLCDWANWDVRYAALMQRLAWSEKSSEPFSLLAVTDSGALQRRAAEGWARRMSAGMEAAPVVPRVGRSERIRVGYYSADFHEHATAYLAAQLFEQHDRERFEVVGLSFGAPSQDAMRARLVKAFDRFIDVRERTDREVAQLSRELGIDIAVDLKGFTQNQRAGIFAHRAAPLQVSYLGYPGTMGAPYMDYLVADRTLIPEASQVHYAEKVVYLPGSYQINDRQRPIAQHEFTRGELGLPPSGVVYCCFNNAYKITPEVFGSWMRILQRVEGSVLWLLQDSVTAVENLQREAQARGVSAQRLIFAQRLPLAEHLARQRVADLFLDTFPCNAHTTASDALWAGLPVLTRCGEAFAARVAASLLNAIGLPELITATAGGYEDLAVELGQQPAGLAALRTRLARNRTSAPLFDSQQLTDHLQEAYRLMHERYLAGLPPEHLYVAL
jgi:predicted O-linked N-acetylglucosamine transferase (SPINDLY family)